MKYIAMHSKTTVKAGSKEDVRGQLLCSLLNIREQYWEMVAFTCEEVEYMTYMMYVRNNSSLYICVSSNVNNG